MSIHTVTCDECDDEEEVEQSYHGVELQGPKLFTGGTV